MPDGFSQNTPPAQPANVTPQAPVVIAAPAFDATPPIAAAPPIVVALPPLLVAHPAPPLLVEHPSPPLLQAHIPIVVATPAGLKPEPTPGSTPPPAPTPPEPENAAETDETQAEEAAPEKPRRKTRKRRKKPSNRRIIFTALRDFGITMALLVVVLQFFAPTIVREHSMENTLMPNEILYVTKQAYWFGPPGYNDIIIFDTGLQTDNGADKTLVKRIVGVPGDRISIQNGSVFRNGEQLIEPYTKSGMTPGSMNEVVVPEDAYFVLGDNREVSRDSRSEDVGFVTRDQISGQVLFRAFPLNKLKAF
jgi:signal peptidase I